MEYADAWQARAFTRSEKLRLASEAAADPQLLRYRPVPGSDMDPLKPPGFAGTDWPSVDELLTLRSNGIVTYRDDFIYATTHSAIADRIQRWLALPDDQAGVEFKETRDRKAGPARRLPFDDGAIERVSYRPLDVRFLYNLREFVDFPKRALQEAWGTENVALFALNDGTGAGPAVWCHGLKPDQHAFRGSYGGWVFPFRNHTAEGPGHFLVPNLVGGLAAAYGRPVAPIDIFDTVLALLSAFSYTTRFGFDLEDDFPHIPFPADPAVFNTAAGLGSRIRSLEGFGLAPGAGFRGARLTGRASGATLDVPSPQRAFAGTGSVGSIALLRDRSLSIAGVTERVWRFEISGYPVLYRWLRARNGESITGPTGAALLREGLDVAWRIAELIDLFDRANAVLARALEAPLTRADLDLPRRSAVAVAADDEDTPG